MLVANLVCFLFCGGVILHPLPPDIKITQVDLVKKVGVDITAFGA